MSSDPAAARPLDAAPGLHFARRPDGVDEVEFAVAGGTGTVLLNRPRAINSLNHAMVRDLAATLEQWRSWPEVERVVVRGAGERGLCAGGDVKAARECILAGDPGAAARFWAQEYALLAAIARYPKPVEVVMTGIVMGGGLGLGMHAARRPVSPDARIAMPETGIGFFPDAGSCRLLSRAPGELGTYAALTGVTVTAADAIALGLADAPPDRNGPAAPLLRERDWIDDCFAGNDPGAIVRRLERHTDRRAWTCGELVRSRSPLSVAIALERIRRARHERDLDESLAVDAHVAAAMMRDSDFVEGVRAAVIDRDAPRWRHRCIEDVSRDEVIRYFA